MCERNEKSAGAGGAKGGPPIECKPDEKKKKCKTSKQEEEEDPACKEPAPWAANKPLFLMDANDPVNDERIKCLKDCHVEPVYKIYQECNKRVTRKLRYTAETCHEETVDLVEALDKCVKSRAFRRLV